jgi:hypothetical protein
MILGDLTLCVVCKNETEATTWKAAESITGLGLVEIVENSGGKHGGLGLIASRLLAKCKTKVFGLVHGDTWFEDFEPFIREALAGNVSGIVGRTLDGAYVWSKPGHTAEHPVKIRHGGGEVSCLDGCSVFFPVTPALGLQFDTDRFDGFHCVVEDVCLQARMKGAKIIVPSGNADHLSGMPSMPWLSDFSRYCTILQKKYPNIPYMQT